MAKVEASEIKLYPHGENMFRVTDGRTFSLVFGGDRKNAEAVLVAQRERVLRRALDRYNSGSSGPYPKEQVMELVVTSVGVTGE